MTGDHEMERAEQLLRSVFTEQATGRTAPAGLAATVAARHRRQRRALVSAAAAAAVVVGAGIPAGLTLARSDRPVPAVPVASPRPAWSPPGRAPSGDACLPKVGPLAAPVPADRLPRQSGVRGSLGRNEAVVDRVLVAGWQGLGTKRPGIPAMDPGAVKVVFVERAGPGVLALVTAFNRAGDYGANTWVVGRDRWFVSIGGGAGEKRPGNEEFLRKLGSLHYGADPLLITMQQVCGRWFGVVLASPDSTAVLYPASHIGPDTRPVTPAGRPLPLAAGIAVFPTDPVGREKVTVSRNGRPVVTRQLNSDGGGPIDTRPLVSEAEIAQAAREGAGTPDARRVRGLVAMMAADLSKATADRPTGLRFVWGGPVTDRRHASLVALMLPSGAAFVDSEVTEGPGQYGRSGGGIRGLVSAGQLDDAVLGWQMPDGLVVVVAPAAARAEVVLFDNSVHPVPLTDGGGGYVAKPAWAKLIRAYRADGSLLGSIDPTVPLPQLPTTM